jgi:hypothetical protein
MSHLLNTDYRRTIREENPLYSFVYFFRSWKKLGGGSWLHIQVVCFWIVLIGAVGFGPIYLLDHARLLESDIRIESHYRPEFIIISLSYFVIMLGNFLYLFDIYRQSADAGRENTMVWKLYSISLLICLCCIITCALALRSLQLEDDINNMVTNTEQFTLFIFAGFFGVDLLMMIAKVNQIRRYRRQHPAGPDPRDLRSEKRFIFNQMILIDIPVLLGVLFIGFFSERAYRVGFYFTAHEEFKHVPIDFPSSRDSYELFRNYFAVGAIGMHVIFSQFIFIILNTRSLFRKIREEVYRRSSKGGIV